MDGTDALPFFLDSDIFAAPQAAPFPQISIRIAD